MAFLITIAITNIAIVLLIIFFLRWFFKGSKNQSTGTSTYSEPKQAAPQTKTVQYTNTAQTQKAKKSDLDIPVNSGRADGMIKPASQEEIKGMDFIKDVYNLPDGPEKTSYLMAFAEAGNAGAQYVLGEAYIFAKGGLKRNFKKAKELLDKSAEQGNPNAMADLGLLCMELVGDVFEEADRKGEPEEEYMPKAMKLVDEAANNFAKALTNYGMPGFVLAERVYNGTMQMDWNKDGMRELLLRKIDEELQPLQEALKETDDGYSNYVLGNLAVRGIGAPQDIAQAKAYFERGAELGHIESKLELQNPLFALDDDDE